MIDLGVVKLDWTISAGQVMVTGSLTAVGYGIRQIFKVIVAFVERVNINDKRLDDTQIMVDRHSRQLMRFKPLGPPVKRLYQRRFNDSSHVTASDDDEQLIVP